MKAVSDMLSITRSKLIEWVSRRAKPCGLQGCVNGVPAS
jgi:hypothetical protein